MLQPPTILAQQDKPRSFHHTRSTSSIQHHFSSTNSSAASTMRILKISAALALALASATSADMTASAALTTSAAVATVSADQGSSIAAERAQQTPSAGHIGSVIASFAHRVACSKGGLFNAFCDHSQTAAPHLRRNEIIGHAMQTTTSWTTIESTSTVGSVRRHFLRDLPAHANSSRLLPPSTWPRAEPTPPLTEWAGSNSLSKRSTPPVPSPTLRTASALSILPL